MADNHISNVVPFGNRESNLTTAMHDDAVAILSVCRDRLIDRVSAVLTRQIGRANDEFLAMADRAGSLEQQQICFSATQFLSNRAPQLLQQFRASFVSAFESVLDGPNTAQGKPLELPSELSLVDDEDLEQDLTITKLTTRAAFNCSQQLVALDRRLAALLKVPRITQDDNPLHPSLVFKSMLQALTEMDVERRIALALLQSFERHVGSELPTIYAEVNRYLAETGVLPTMSLKTPQEPPSSYQGDGRAGSVGGAPGYVGTGQPGLASSGAVQGGYGGMPAQASGQDIFSQLLQAIQSIQAAPPPGGGGVWMSGGMMPAGAGGGVPAQPISSAQLVETLGSLQRGQPSASQMSGLGSVQIDPYSGNALQQLRATPMASWSQPMDAVTMDIVAMLFDAMFNDPDLPAGVRAEIAKLQIPILKVALLDKKFFSDRGHPARRFLDVIAHAGMGRGPEEMPRLAEKIRTVVEAVVKGFDSDVQIFATQVGELTRFLQEEDATAKSKAVGMVDALEARERKEMAPARAAAEVELRVNRRSLPVLIADFLSRHWRLVLVEAFVRVGESGEAWKETLGLMDDLIWSVEAKSSSQERDRLVVMLPSILKGLRQGLERVGLQGAWDGFFSELIQLHVAALRKDGGPDLYPQGMRDPAPSPTARPSASSLSAGLNDEQVPESSTPAAPKAPARPAATSPGDDYLGLVQKLEVGAWVEFQSERGTRSTLRLNWVSELRRVFLFTNRQGENAMTLAADSLADHFRKGTARLLSQNPLTDRAVAQVLNKIKPAASGSAGGSRPRGYAWE